MKKVFEDYFSELQADMVSICLEYIEKRADMIYIHISCDKSMTSPDFFYKINDKILEKDEVNQVITTSEKLYDISDERQGAVLHILADDMNKIEELCKKFQKDIPTEIKLIYDIKRNKLQAKYNYDEVFPQDGSKGPMAVYEEWFEEIKKENNQ